MGEKWYAATEAAILEELEKLDGSISALWCWEDGWEWSKIFEADWAVKIPAAIDEYVWFSTWIEGISLLGL